MIKKHQAPEAHSVLDVLNEKVMIGHLPKYSI